MERKISITLQADLTLKVRATEETVASKARDKIREALEGTGIEVWFQDIVEIDGKPV